MYTCASRLSRGIQFSTSTTHGEGHHPQGCGRVDTNEFTFLHHACSALFFRHCPWSLELEDTCQFQDDISTGCGREAWQGE